jgi:uncharacterized protein (TIGR03437 family)
MIARKTAAPAAALLLALGFTAHAAVTLNLSRDLVSNGIAQANMTPNTPSLDSRPLFEAGISWAGSHGVTNVIADRGSYYFLTLGAANHHASISVSNLAIDLQYSDLYFANANAIGLICNLCSNVVLQNFTMDYVNLPFTQVQVTSVNAAARTIGFQTISGWPSPTALNAFPSAGAKYLMFVFRNGQQIRQTAWLPATAPFSGTTLQVAPEILQGGLTANLSAIEPGDTVVVTYRNGGGMLYFARASNSVIRNVSIYSSAQFAFDVQMVSNTVLDQLQVIPRPGTGRLISANADGIHISTSGANNVISNSTVRRACDDAIIIDGQWYATVNGPATGTTVAVTLSSSSAVSLAPGMSVDFINVANASVIATANITAVSTPPAQQALGQTLTLTLDQSLASLKAGYGVIPSDPAFRGGNSVIRGNLVQEEVFDRGIYIPGVKNVTVTDNLISSTNNGGIVIGEDDVTTYAFKTGPASGVTIHNNAVDNALEYGYPSMPTNENGGAISDYVTDQNSAYVTTMPDSNFTITGNLITNTPRSAIRVQSLNGGTISGNTILNSNLEPTSYIDIFTANWGETLQQIEADFALPVVMANSTGVSSSNNSGSGTVVISASDASGGLRLAPGAIAAAYGTNLAPSLVINQSATLPTSIGNVSVTVTDSAGTARKAGLFFVSSGQIDYQVPPGTAPGVARVTIGNATGAALIGSVAPGLFSANASGSGVAAAIAVRVAADGTQTPLSVFQCASTCVSTPLDLGSASDTLVVELYGTGIQGASSIANVVAQANGIAIPVQYAGPQMQYPGLDQVNLIIPRSLAGAGEIPVIVTVDGQTANAVTINLK